MKSFKLLFSSFIAIAFVASCQKYDDSQLKSDISSLEGRVSALEQICKQTNSDISAIQSSIEALESNLSVREVVSESDGYVVSFTNGMTIHIYHGTDGKDGIDGRDGNDGQDGTTPVIGVKCSNSGIYYWTLNGEWLTNEKGELIPVSGENGINGKDGADGKNGADGKDGKDGEKGTDGKDGITPELKIDNGSWFISTDGGSSWTNLGPATGKDGDTLFKSVTEDSNYAYLNLADGTVIKLPKEKILSLNFESTSFHPASSQIIVPFTVNGGGSDLRVYTFSEGSLTASVTLGNSGTGKVTVNFTSAEYTGNVLVVAKSNGASVIEVLEFEKGCLSTTSSDTIPVGYEGGEFAVTVSHNMSISVSTNVDWIKKKETRSMVEESFGFTVAKNNTMNDRTGYVYIKSTEDDTSLKFEVTQKAKEVLKLGETSKIMMLGDTYQLTYQTNLKGNLSWSSSNSSVASVDSNGLVSALAKGTAVITVSGNDGSISSSCEITVKSFTGTIAGHGYVDLGLPSGKLWATTNVGASTETGYGSYYMWSNVGVVENLWGTKWSAPTSTEVNELLNYCSYEWTYKNGVNGYLFTGANGATMFLPAAGFKIYVDGYGYSDVQSGGSHLTYWTETKSSYSWEGQAFAFTLDGTSSSLSANTTLNTSLTAATIRPISR